MGTLEKTIEKSPDILLALNTLISSIGYLEVLFLILIIVSPFIVRQILRFFEKRKQQKNDDLKNKNREEELKQLQIKNDQINNLIGVFLDINQKLFYSLEKLQFSISIQKIEVLSKIYLGLDMAFIPFAKSKILTYTDFLKDNKYNESNFRHLYFEFDNGLRNILLENLKPHIFRDISVHKEVEVKARKLLKDFLDMIHEEIKKNHEKEVNITEYIRVILESDEKGIYDLCTKILKIVLDKYENDILSDKDISYTKSN